MRYHIGFIVALLLLCAPAAAVEPRDAALQALAAYREGRAAKMLDVELACWRAPTAATADSCVRRLIAGSVIDLARQRTERRGPAPSYALEVQLARLLEQTARLGLSRPDAEALFRRVHGASLDPIVAALADAGL